jgi:hypothetical protein
MVAGQLLELGTAVEHALDMELVLVVAQHMTIRIFIYFFVLEIIN